jgi:transcriptional regulator with XRE-family HTH domain
VFSVVAYNIKRIIKGLGTKNKFIAEKAGYTEQQFSDMLHGRKLITDVDIPKLAKALGVTPNELFKTPTQ